MDYNENGLCDGDETVGCTYPSATNYNNEASLDNGTCEFSCAADINGDGDIQLNDLLDLLSAYGTSCGECPDADQDGICDYADTCIGEEDACGVCNGDGLSCLGCTDSEACNFDASSTINDGSCTYISAEACDCDGNVLDECGVCGGAGIAEGACDCEGNVEDALSVCGGDCPLDANNDGVCDTEQEEGCTYPAACNYNPYAAFEDGSCDFFGCVIAGCTDPESCDYDQRPPTKMVLVPMQDALTPMRATLMAMLGVMTALAPIPVVSMRPRAILMPRPGVMTVHASMEGASTLRHTIMTKLQVATMGLASTRDALTRRLAILSQLQASTMSPVRTPAVKM